MNKEKNNGKNKEKYTLFILLHLLLLFYTLGGILSKLASKGEFLSIKFLLLYASVITILFIYATCWQQLIKKLPLTIAYANRAVCVLWGMLWGALFFHEQITFQMLAGAAVVIVGIIVVTLDE